MSSSNSPGDSVGYVEQVRRFSRNAKLFLAYDLLSGLGTGIWAVMFNLYLLRVGFSVTFVGEYWGINMLFHGLAAFPAGLIGDKIGRRKAFILATTLSVCARGVLLFTLDPSWLLVFAAIAGIGDGFHGVTGAPFMMENSEREERPLLFSLDASFLQVSIFVGSLSGGFLPLFWAGILGVPLLDPQAARLALVLSLPLTLISLIPLAIMKEKPVELVESFVELFTLSHMVSHGIIARLVLCSAFIGIGFGISTRFFNVFFAEAQGASDDQVGMIMAIGALGAAASILFSPMMTNKWGKVRSILFTQASSVPFLLLMAMVPDLSMVTALFVFRGALYSISMPLRNQLSMEFIESQERATTAGLIHMLFDIGGSAGAWFGGMLMFGGNFVAAFGVASLVFLIPAVLYYVFFAAMERRQLALGLARRRG
ncbi:MAG: MFS transporter [Chloroflexi bacterium]|nr:MFS transporter [Chloroflexota bacterium]